MIKIFGFNRTENNDIRVFFQHYLKRTNKLSGKAPILSSLKLDDFLSKFQC